MNLSSYYLLYSNLYYYSELINTALFWKITSTMYPNHKIKLSDSCFFNIITAYLFSRYLNNDNEQIKKTILFSKCQLFLIELSYELL